MRRPPPRSLIVFDLDGTLIDSVPDLARAVGAFLGRHGFPGVAEGEMRGMMGDGAAELLGRCLAARQIALPQGRIAALAEEFLDLYDAWPHRNTRLYAGVAEHLPRLAAAGYTLAVCTNKRAALARAILDELGVGRHVSALAGAGSTPKLKPDPAPLRLILENLAKTPRDCVVVGDSANDIRMARAVGASSIGCRYGYLKHPGELDGADAVIDRFDALPQALDSLR